MIDLPFNDGELDDLILRLKSIMAREATDIPDPGGNATDDEIPAMLQETEGDLSRDELTQQIGSFYPDQQAALVALFWIGRGDAEASDWDDTLALAHARHTGRVSTYLLGKPMVAGFLEEGLAKLREADLLDED